MIDRFVLKVRPKMYTLYYLLIVLVFVSCRTSYIDQVPSQFDYDEAEIRDELYAKKPTIPPSTGYTDYQLHLIDKYSQMLEVPKDNIRNFTLYGMVDRFLNAPYVLVGLSEAGVSMSSFVPKYYLDYYSESLPSSAYEIYNSQKFTIFNNQKLLQNGDVVFLRKNIGEPVSDMALYLANGYVLYSSTQRGLYIFKLIDPYFQERYVGSGRLK